MRVPVGTPYSIAPECLSGAYTVQCDLWSIGVLTFMLLAGKPPFVGRWVHVTVAPGTGMAAGATLLAARFGSCLGLVVGCCVLEPPRSLGDLVACSFLGHPRWRS